MSKNIDAIVFDVDGTLVDTREFIFRSYEHVAQKNGYKQPGRDVIATRIGHRLDENMSYLFPGSDTQRLLADHREFQKHNLHLVGSHIHAKTLVERLRARNYKVALWTSRRRNLGSVLESAGLKPEFFDAIVDGDMVTHGKPDPEGLRLVLKKLDVSPRRSIMVGDADVDIAAARAIGIHVTVGLTHGFGTREELQAAGADYIIDSLLQLPAILDTIEQS